MRRFLKVLPLTLALVLALAGMGLVLTSCNSSQAQARFVDAIGSLNQTEIDIEVDGGRDFTSLTFPSYQPTSGYRPVASGSDTIEGVISGGTTSEFSTPNVNLSSGSEYTLVATGVAPNNVIILNPTDDNSEPANGQVSFRIIDAAISSPSQLAVYILPNQENGQPPTITSSTPVTAAPTGPSSPATATSAYETQSFNSLNTGFTGEVCTFGSTIPIFTFAIANFGGANEGAIRTIVLTDNSSQTGFDPSPLILSDLN
ncbi:MAG: DUF4397 domain-containing protein [Terriglobales bacterium]|jgi:hypothetical protein